MYSNDGFQHKIHEQVDVGAGSTRVQAVLTPFEAGVLRELLGSTKMDLASREVDADSLDARLALAEGGQNGPLSGQAEYYK